MTAEIDYKWPDYELIDSGGFEKLERYGKYILRRPEPQALWDKHLPVDRWINMAHASFFKTKGITEEGNEKGRWEYKPDMPSQWYVSVPVGENTFRMRLAFTSFKHIGIFPEQVANWQYVYEKVKILGPGTTVLNLFAYTGGASLAARAAGAEVTHVEAVRQVVSWANENMKASRLDNIRWMVDDAVKYVKREVRRGKKYHGIILDPPAYGRGPEGEKWILDEELNNLLKNCCQLLFPGKHFVVLNMYSMGYSAHVAENLISTVFRPFHTEAMELGFRDCGRRFLPLGVTARYATV